MAIIIKGNKGFNIGGDLIRVDVPHDVELEISDNERTSCWTAKSVVSPQRGPLQRRYMYIGVLS